MIRCSCRPYEVTDERLASLFMLEVLSHGHNATPAHVMQHYKRGFSETVCGKCPLGIMNLAKEFLAEVAAGASSRHAHAHEEEALLAAALPLHHRHHHEPKKLCDALAAMLCETNTHRHHRRGVYAWAYVAAAVAAHHHTMYPVRPLETAEELKAAA